MSTGKKIAIWSGVLLGAGTLLYFGYNYIQNQIKLLTKLGYKFVGYKILKFSFQQIIVDIDLELENQSNIGITLNGYNIDVSMNGQNVAKLQNDKLSQYLAPNGKSQIKLNVSFVPGDVLKQAFNLQNILTSLTNPDAIVFGFNGTVSAKTTGLMVKNYPISVTLPLSKMLPSAPASVAKS